MRRLGVALLVLVCAFFIVRAVAELFIVDFSDPGSYRNDWGGPTLLGVLAVHMLPGVAAAAVLWRVFRDRDRGRRKSDPPPNE